MASESHSSQCSRLPLPIDYRNQARQNSFGQRTLLHLSILRFFPDSTPELDFWYLELELQSPAQTLSSLTFHMLYPSTADGPLDFKPLAHFNHFRPSLSPSSLTLVTVPCLYSQASSVSPSHPLSRALPPSSQPSGHHLTQFIALKIMLEASASTSCT